jgi:hypothetical protein
MVELINNDDDTKSELGDHPFSTKKLTCNFSKQILKSMVGIERAELALKSISMGMLPRNDIKQAFSIDRKFIHESDPSSHSESTEHW